MDVLDAVLLTIGLLMTACGAAGLWKVVRDFKNPHSLKHLKAVRAVNNLGGLQEFQRHMVTLLLLGSFIVVCGIAMKLIIQSFPVGYWLPLVLCLIGLTMAGYGLHAIMVSYKPGHPFYPFYDYFVGRKYGGMVQMRRKICWQVALGIFLIICGVVMAVAQL